MVKWTRIAMLVIFVVCLIIVAAYLLNFNINMINGNGNNNTITNNTPIPRPPARCSAIFTNDNGQPLQCEEDASTENSPHTIFYVRVEGMHCQTDLNQSCNDKIFMIVDQSQ